MDNINIPTPPNNNFMDKLHKEHPMKVKLIIIFSILLLVVLIVLFVLNKPKKPVKVYTPEQKAEQMKEVLDRTKEQGVPPIKDQLDIMKLNAQ